MEQNNIIIQQLASEDILKKCPLISQLQLDCFGFTWQESAWQDLLNQDYIISFCAFAKPNKLVGLIIISLACDEAEIINIMVARNYQRQKIGQNIVKHTINFLNRHKVAKLFLEVEKNNKVAINLYKKLNFKPIAIRKNYYHHGKEKTDAIVMCYNLCLN